ncbi:Putative BEN domain-containing protein B1 [Frankliniella fusca]|uniref:BEN domain-containing protein B1 n=1 Tax=Frankliniella fusca TaxID=407009 RepID=A0AAE1LDK9_9NEOP|nr:Putative BEN domain-containing protein B1 [Frankliniella fusca]
MWFILYCDEDNSHSIIHDKFVLNVAGVEKNDKVSYFYRNKPYIGTVVDFSENYDVLALELKKLGSTPVRVSTNVDKNSDNKPTTSKRTSVPPVRFGESLSLKRKPDEELKKKKHLLELNKKNATLKENKSLLGKLSKQDDDREWTPEENHDINNSKDDDSDSDTALSSYLVNKKKERVELVKGIKRLPATTYQQEQSKAEADSPSKEDLKRQLHEMKVKLQLVYDAEDDKDKNSERTKQDNTGAQGRSRQPSPQGRSRQPSPQGRSRQPSPFELDDELTPVGNDEKGAMDKSAQSEGSLGDADLGDGDDIDHDYELTKHQLLGKQSKDMVHLVDDVYCKANAVSKALCGGTAVSHVARRLIEGVFKEESLINCTLSGQPYRVVPGHPTEVEGLNAKAVNAIIKYARATGKKRNWPKMKTSEIKVAMTQRLGEIKRRLKKKDQHK